MLVDAFDWHIVFVATTPVALLAIPLAAVLPSREASGAWPRLDWQGLLLVMAALALALQGLTHGHREGWDESGTLLRLGVAATCAAAFLLWEAHQPFPVLNLRLFANRGFALSALAILLTGVAVYGSTYLIPLFAQLIQHYSPASAGLLLAPAGIALAVGFPLAGRLSDWTDARLLLAAGAAIFGASMLFLSSLSTRVSFASMATWVALSRFGVGILMPAANASAMKQVDPSMLAFAAPAATFLTQTGGALGVATLSVLIQERAAFHIAGMTPLMTEANGQALEALGRLTDSFIEAGAPAPIASFNAEQQLAASMWLSAQVLAFRDCFVLIAWAFAGLMLAIPYIPKGQERRKAREIEPAQVGID